MRVATAILLFAAQTALSETPAGTAPHTCDTVDARILGADPVLAASACTHLQAAAVHFAACALPPPPPVEVTITNKIYATCVGLYHCGEQRIEVLSPSALTPLRDRLDRFGHLTPERLFASVLLHEYAHAVFDGTPCPYETCIASSEYFAYTLQIAALTDAERAPFEARIVPEARPPRDMISSIMLFAAPDRFIDAAWAHFRTHPDACRQWQAVVEGLEVFDNLHP